MSASSEPIASTIRVYRLKAGRAPSRPAGIGQAHGPASRTELRHEAKKIWRAEIETMTARAVDPAWVLANELGADLLMASLQHPKAGILAVTIIAIEPA